RRRAGEHRKVGYSGFVLEKEFSNEGIRYTAHLELLLNGLLPQISFLPTPGLDSSRLEVSGRILLDEALKALELRLRVLIRIVETEAITLEHELFLYGRPKEGVSDRLEVALRRGDDVLVRFDVPATDLVPSDGLAPAVTLGNLEVGQKYDVKVLDPLSVFGPSDQTATVEVIEERTIDVGGGPVDVHVVDMRWRHSTVRALVTRGGDIVRQEIPKLGLVLEHADDRKDALRGLEP
ncbi:MAG TPA: hypothetical protein VK116_06485, partial [Planctomycetota bacterium]|nr:hypothetical protein [Planctomycetota bacterium]